MDHGDTLSPLFPENGSHPTHRSWDVLMQSYFRSIKDYFEITDL